MGKLTTERLITIIPRMKLLNRLDREEDEIQELIDEIVQFPDPEVSRVLYRKYVQGDSWTRIGMDMGQPPDTIRMYVRRKMRRMEEQRNAKDTLRQA